MTRDTKEDLVPDLSQVKDGDPEETLPDSPHPTSTLETTLSPEYYAAHNNPLSELPRMPHFEVGPPSEDMSEETVQLDVTALRLGLEVPVAKKRPMPQSNKTVPFEAATLFKMVEESSKNTQEAKTEDLRKSIALAKSLRVDDDRTIEADLSVLSESMMAMEDPRQRPTTEVDVRILAQRLTSEILLARNKSKPRTSPEVNNIALDVATEVVSKRVIGTQETTIKGDLSQLAQEIAEKVKLVKATQELDFDSRYAMEELAFELAAQLEQEALQMAEGLIEPPPPLVPRPHQHTMEVDPADVIVSEEAPTSPSGQLPHLPSSLFMEPPSHPSVGLPPLTAADLESDFDEDEDDFLSDDPPTIRREIPAEAIAALDALDLAQTIETSNEDAIKDVISKAIADSESLMAARTSTEEEPEEEDDREDSSPLLDAAALAPPSQPLSAASAPAPQPLLEQPPPSNRKYMVISAMLIFLIVALSTAAALVYLLR